MRRVNLEDWSRERKKRIESIKKGVRKRPKSDWKLNDAILYIRMRNKYLKKNGILVKISARNYKLNVQI